MKYTIEYEEILKQWVVFKVEKSLKTEVFRHKYKSVCKEFKKTMEDEESGRKRNKKRESKVR